MQAPVPMISGAGSAKAVAVVAVLIGLFAAAAIRQQQTTPPARR